MIECLNPVEPLNCLISGFIFNTIDYIRTDDFFVDLTERENLKTKT